MKTDEVGKAVLAGRRVIVASFVAHRFREVKRTGGNVIGIVNLIEVQCGDGFAPTVQTWLPRDVKDLSQAENKHPCVFKVGQKLVVEFTEIAPNRFDAKNGIMIRATGIEILN